MIDTLFLANKMLSYCNKFIEIIILPLKALQSTFTSYTNNRQKVTIYY